MPGNTLAHSGGRSQDRNRQRRKRRSEGEERPRKVRGLFPGVDGEGGAGGGGQVEEEGGGGGEGRGGGGGGTEGVMYPRDGAPAGPEETGAKAGVLGPGLSLLQQVGCWHLNLSSWVSNAAPLLLHCLCFFLPLKGFNIVLTGSCCGAGRL